MKAFFSTLMAVLTAIASFFSSGGITQLLNKGDISGYADSISSYEELPDFEADENGDFTVLQFSDTHFTTGLSWADISVLNKMEEQILTYSPDLVVISGDMIDDGNVGAFNKQYVLDTVGELFDSLEQYWAYIPGNNDGINYGTASDVAAYLSQFEYCLVADLPEISGATQYSIDITKDGELVHSLIFLDTMDYDDEDDEHIYGYVHEDQVLWCADEIAEKQAISEDVTISVFVHENTANFAVAALYGEAYKEGYATLDEVAEKYDIPKNAPLDEVFENAGCVGLVSMGHVHPSECKCSYYNGIYYHITPKTKTMSTLITIHTGADNTRDMYDFEQVTS
ncbi:MAG: metallophosphoesterase [Clostridiales bacterium]|nr:metallophosphoesterase [Clostridiales bacterium]